MTFLNINECFFGGRITADPELKQTTGKVPYVHFSLAVEDEYQKADTEQKAVEFPNCIAWRGDAVFLCKHAQKGDVVTLKSEFKLNRFTDKKDVDRREALFRVKPGTLKIVQCKKWDEKAAGHKSHGAAPQVPVPPSGSDNFTELDDDGGLPF
jgi:single-strand DNA-binding protein